MPSRSGSKKGRAAGAGTVGTSAGSRSKVVSIERWKCSLKEQEEKTQARTAEMSSADRTQHSKTRARKQVELLTLIVSDEIADQDLDFLIAATAGLPSRTKSDAP